MLMNLAELAAYVRDVKPESDVHSNLPNHRSPQEKQWFQCCRCVYNKKIVSKRKDVFKRNFKRNLTKGTSKGYDLFVFFFGLILK